MGTDTLALAAILTPLVLFLASLLKSASFPASLNILIATILSLVVAVTSLAITGEVQSFDDVDTLDEIIPLTAMVYALAQIVYRTYFRATPVNEGLTNAVWRPKQE